MSIFLLKEGFDASNSLDVQPMVPDEAEGLPQGASIFVFEGPPTTPEWATYVKLKREVTRSSLSAIAFIPAAGRVFAVSFGHAYHKLAEESYEHDFGLYAMLNGVDPKKLKATDAADPGAARMKRVQGQLDSDLTILDFRYNAEVLKSLAGKMLPEFNKWFASASGSASLRIKAKVECERLDELCAVVLELANSENYKKTFPGAQNLARVRDPELVAQLDAALLRAIRTRAPRLEMAIPEIVEFEGTLIGRFSGAGPGEELSDVYIQAYYDYLSKNGIDLNAVTLTSLQRVHRLHVSDGVGAYKKYSVYRALVLETKLAGQEDSFHLLDRCWYRAAAKFMTELDDDVDAACVNSFLPNFDHASEGAFNLDVAKGNPKFLCLDTTNVAPKGSTPVEPCDLFAVISGAATLIHVKVSTLSFKLSHLFSQGLTALELLRQEEKARTSLKRLITKHAHPDEINRMSRAVNAGKFNIVYAIVTHKPPEGKASNLPLFSRITLRRSIKTARAMGANAYYCFVKAPKKAKKVKPAKAA